MNADNSYKMLAFDLDDTLAISKSPINYRMKQHIEVLLDKFDICIITGGTYGQIMENVVEKLDLNISQKKRLHAISVSGARYDKFSEADSIWKTIYRLEIPIEERYEIIKKLKEVVEKHGLWENNPTGEIIQDRVMQVTFSALGQDADPRSKALWDNDYKKRQLLRKDVATALPKYEVLINGKTSIDVVQDGIDKAYGLNQLIECVGINKENVLFFGDSLKPGGNDYPVKQAGYDCIEVNRWEDTAQYIEENLII